MKYELNRLGAEQFEALVQALASAVAGFEVKIFGKGPDGQREFTLEKNGLSFAEAETLGYTVGQAKFRYPDNQSDDQISWLKRNLDKELEGFRKKKEEGKRIPDTWLFFTNVTLTPVANKGGRDTIEAYLKEKGYDKLIPHIHILAADDICSLLHAHPQVAERFSQFLTSGDVLAAVKRRVEADEKQAEELRIHLAQLMETTRRDHPSFKLMRPDDLDPDLLPRFQDAKRLPALGSIGEGDISPVWDLIAKSWQDGRNHSIVLEGEGGIGKTVALLSPEGEGAKSVPALYIPLFELVSDDKAIPVEHYLQRRLGAYWAPFEKLACASWNSKPSLLLLLDGVNELPVQHRFLVVSSIKNWAKDRPGVQVVAVSRPLSGMKLEDELPDALSVRLAPVGVETVKTYLCKLGREIPPDNDPLWEVLRLPLFLVLYAKTGKLEGKTVCGYPLAPRPESGKGAVIWNYLQRELMRRNEEDWVLRCAVACEYLLPAVGYEMVKNSRFTIGKDVLDRIIRQALSRLPQSLPRHLRTLFDVYDDIHEAQPDFAGVKWRSMLIHELGLLTGYREERNTYTFLHQHFRDAFAGLYLVNAAEAEPGLPELWQHAQPPLALDYAAPLMEEEDAAALWSALPRQSPVSREALYVQLELQRRRRGGDFSHLDFSHMDLRDISLARYGKGLFRNPAYARGTRLNKAVFSVVGHSKPVSCVAALPNGRMVSGSDDYTLRVWDSYTGDCLRVLEGHTGVVTCVTALPDGRMVSGSRDNTLRVWREGKDGDWESRELNRHTGYVTCVTALPDGRMVSGSWDSTLRVWREGQDGDWEGRELEGHTDWANCVAALPDGRIVSGSADCTLRVWREGKDGDWESRALNGHTSPVTCVTALPDGRIVSGSADSTLRVWREGKDGDWESRALNGHTSPVTCVTALRDGCMVSGSADCTLRVWREGKDGNWESRELEGHTGRVHCVTVLPDGRIVSGSGDETLRFWSPEGGNALDCLGQMLPGVIAAAVLNGNRWVSAHRDGTLRLWDGGCGRFLHLLRGHSEAVTCMAKLPDGRMVSGSYDETLRVWREGKDWSWKSRALKGHTDGVRSVTALRDRRIVSGSGDETLRVWREGKDGDWESRVLKGHTGDADCVTALRDGRIVESVGGTLRVWKEGKDGDWKSRELKGHIFVVYCVTALRDGRIVSGSNDRTLRVWREGKDGSWESRELKGHTDDVYCVTALRDGRIVSGSWDKTLRVWDSDTGDCLRVLEGHTAAVRTVAALENGWVLSGADDCTLRVWDGDRGRCLAVIPVSEMDMVGMDLRHATMDEETARLLYYNGAEVPEAYRGALEKELEV